MMTSVNSFDLHFLSPQFEDTSSVWRNNLQAFEYATISLAFMSASPWLLAKLATLSQILSDHPQFPCSSLPLSFNKGAMAQWCASDSRSEGWAFESLWPHFTCLGCHGCCNAVCCSRLARKVRTRRFNKRDTARFRRNWFLWALIRLCVGHML